MESKHEEPEINGLLVISSIVQELQHTRNEIKSLSDKEKQLVFQLQKLVLELKLSHKTSHTGPEYYPMPDVLKVDIPQVFNLQKSMSPPLKAKLRRQKSEQRTQIEEEKQPQRDLNPKPENLEWQFTTAKNVKPTERKLV